MPHRRHKDLYKAQMQELQLHLHREGLYFRQAEYQRLPPKLNAVSFDEPRLTPATQSRVIPARPDMAPSEMPYKPSLRNDMRRNSTRTFA